MPSLNAPPLNNAQRVSHHVRTLLSQELQKKQTGSNEEESDSSHNQRVLCLYDDIKDLHAEAIANTRDSKQQTADAKASMDASQVGLQNIMYEKRHLLEEIMKCRAFKSVYQDVELVPLEDFYAHAPKRYRDDDDNPHQLMIKRLKYEYDERASLKQEQEKLQAERLQLIRENRKAQERLDRIDKLLDDFVQASIPVEEALKEQLKKTSNEQEHDHDHDHEKNNENENDDKKENDKESEKENMNENENESESENNK